MGNLFGKPNAKKASTSRVTEQDKVVLQMKQQRDKLKQYRRQLENRLEKERGVAARLVRENKRERALIILRKKKHMEKLIQNVEGHIEKIESLTQDVEWAQVEVNVVQNLEKGNEALKSLNALLNIEDIEKMLDETKEAAEKQKEVNDLIVGFAGEIEVDEDELISELEELVGEKETPPADTAETEDIRLPEVLNDDVRTSPERAAGDPSEAVPRAKKQKSDKTEKQMVEA
ncbi:charged multivesicular body protein 6 [Galendromus occidentalis]|uniref:Charged multivesicular body protein 6 n=1 Tax=Galendromus occidentalis TaxID=34638 RepID=A0AAJ6QYF2_9ACAR|nr:charged multivesicular body protein 6 [Galendromus occidentalis]